MSLLPNIIWVLENIPEAKDSDKRLIIEILQIKGAQLSHRQIEIIKSINFESIRRTRQKLNEEGKYLPSEKVAKQRRLKGYIMEVNAPIANPERIEKLINDQPRAISHAVPWLRED